MIEPLAKDKVGGKRLENTGDAVPRTVDVQDVPALETLDQKVDDANVPERPLEKSFGRASACKLLKSKVTDNLG